MVLSVRWWYPAIHFCSWPTDGAVAVLSKCLKAVTVWMGMNNSILARWNRLGFLAPGSDDMSSLTGQACIPHNWAGTQFGDLPGLMAPADDSCDWRGFALINVVHQLYPFLDWEVFYTVIHALVTFCLDYCNILYMCLLFKITLRLQLIQDAAPYIVLDIHRFTHVTFPLCELSWLPVAF